MLDHSSNNLRNIVVGLNEILTEIYGNEIRLSRLLLQLGFDTYQLEIIRRQYMHEVVTSFIISLQERILFFQGGERAYMIISRYYGIDGNPRDTLQSLGEKLSITRERVRQIKVKTVRKCKVKSSREFLELQLKENVTLLLSENGG